MEFKDIIIPLDANKADDKLKEKHIPILKVIEKHGKSEKDYIRVVVGRNTKHPNTPEHHIEWIELYARTKTLNTVKIGSVKFGPGTEPD
ncbi:MAG: desulfoferrodoxin family protein, partial [Euryarchaeota archaeon]|nr:desulfoferrodoxin family protein [Euryarchaeota archaeon]